ncbi:MAG: hypothetical protein PHD81_04785 [Candidatus Nanoarchaeia archaeon]|nr:hypothetical protein [Candidatus Nanoarchaeia archaeon]MDD5588393.1 hypothetical protein [Candidatus Nanoarchaeia archaeon]
MVETYKLTKKEVLKEVCNNTENEFVEVYKSLKVLSKNFLGAAAIVHVIPYIIPRAIIGRSNKKKKLEDYGTLEDSATILGATIGFLSLPIQLDLYSWVGNDYPEFLLLPIVTNVISGAYEIGRFVYNNAEKRVVEKHITESLEAKVQPTEVVQK